jgi:hypothetical protein
MSLVMAGFALEIAQRLVGGHGRERCWDRETYVDLENGQLLAFETPRTERCASGHVRWELIELPRAARTTSLGELLALARAELDHEDVSLEPFAHRIGPLAVCGCGERVLSPGTRWARTGPCPACGGALERRDEGALARLDERLARELGILGSTCLELGLPEHGALLVARAGDRPPVHFLLETAP